MSRRMHLLLWLTACSAALPGSPLPALKLRGSPLPALKLRGGGVQQTLDALPHDAKALAKSFVVLGGFDKFVQHLAASETISRPAARKTMHVGAGPLFLLCWPMFSNEETAKNWAMVGPLALTPPKKPSPGLEGRYRSLLRIDTSAVPAPAARSPGLDLYLESRGLGAYAPRIRALGARKVADLQLLSDEDIDDLGVPKELRVVLKVSLS